MLVSAKEMLVKAKAGHYAVGQFNINNLEWTKAILTAAQDMKSPVILGVSEGASKYMTGYKTVAAMVRAMDEVLGITVPVAIHLDHGEYEGAKKAMMDGYTSVMFDGSKLPLEENIEKTRQVVKVAHACGVSVEAEIGHVAAPEGSVEGSVAKEDLFTRPEDAVTFVEATGIDALAIAFGTVHGVYKGKPNLDFERLASIKSMVDVPLVMHGGSGLPESDFRKAVAGGINKINFFPGMSLATIASMRKMIDETDGRCRYVNLFDTALNTVIDIAKEQMEIFGTQPM